MAYKLIPYKFDIDLKGIHIITMFLKREQVVNKNQKIVSFIDNMV